MTARRENVGCVPDKPPLHRHHRLRQARPAAVIFAAAFPSPIAQLPPSCSTIAIPLPSLPKNKLAFLPRLPPKYQLALLAPCGQKSMSMGTNTFLCCSGWWCSNDLAAFSLDD